ncbi:MAG: winged helix-turn-helix domain-containing protein [Pseudomonadales bacterium]|nr:winged helix-turn-helix domain-containing protein [Pseudomonadales bacterium]
MFHPLKVQENMAKPTENSLKLVELGPYLFDLKSGELSKLGSPVPLRPKASKFLKILLEANGKAVTHDELYREIWEQRIVERLDGLHQLAKDTRRALADYDQELIKNIPGVGYKASLPCSLAAQEPKPIGASIRNAYLGGLLTLPVAFVVYCLAVASGVLT